MEQLLLSNDTAIIADQYKLDMNGALIVRKIDGIRLLHHGSRLHLLPGHQREQGRCNR